jgi:hypothetical protein
MKWDWTKVIRPLIEALIVICGLGGTWAITYYYVQEDKRKEVCPLAQDKLVSVIIEGNKYICVYTREPLKMKKKYTKEMWVGH